MRFSFILVAGLTTFSGFAYAEDLIRVGYSYSDSAFLNDFQNELQKNGATQQGKRKLGHALKKSHYYHFSVGQSEAKEVFQFLASRGKIQFDRTKDYRKNVAQPVRIILWAVELKDESKDIGIYQAYTDQNAASLSFEEAQLPFSTVEKSQIRSDIGKVDEGVFIWALLKQGPLLLSQNSRWSEEERHFKLRFGEQKGDVVKINTSTLQGYEYEIKIQSAFKKKSEMQQGLASLLEQNQCSLRKPGKKVNETRWNCNDGTVFSKVIASELAHSDISLRPLRKISDSKVRLRVQIETLFEDEALSVPLVKLPEKPIYFTTPLLAANSVERSPSSGEEPVFWLEKPQPSKVYSKKVQYLGFSDRIKTIKWGHQTIEADAQGVFKFELDVPDKRTPASEILTVGEGAQVIEQKIELQRENRYRMSLLTGVIPVADKNKTSMAYFGYGDFEAAFDHFFVQSHRADWDYQHWIVNVGHYQTSTLKAGTTDSTHVGLRYRFLGEALNLERGFFLRTAVRNISISSARGQFLGGGLSYVNYLWSPINTVMSWIPGLDVPKTIETFAEVYPISLSNNVLESSVAQGGFTGKIWFSDNFILQGSVIYRSYKILNEGTLKEGKFASTSFEGGFGINF
ncbi:MAG: hypothetical protein AB7O96_06340 [Pseudobdellovibrionaceae bacterium]